MVNLTDLQSMQDSGLEYVETMEIMKNTVDNSQVKVGFLKGIPITMLVAICWKWFPRPLVTHKELFRMNYLIFMRCKVGKSVLSTSSSNFARKTAWSRLEKVLRVGRVW